MWSTSSPNVAPLLLTNILMALSSRTESHHAAARQPTAATGGPPSPHRRAPPRPRAPLPESRLLFRQNPLFLCKKSGLCTSSSACKRGLAQLRRSVTCFSSTDVHAPPSPTDSYYPLHSPSACNTASSLVDSLSRCLREACCCLNPRL